MPLSSAGTGRGWQVDASEVGRERFWVGRKGVERPEGDGSSEAGICDPNQLSRPGSFTLGYLDHHQLNSWQIGKISSE